MMLNDLNSTDEYLSKNFLVGEWKIDSIINSPDLIEEWVYFTNDAKFWRYSYRQRKYLVEGDLDFKYNFIMHNKRDIGYRVVKVDTNHLMMIDSANNKFQLTRWSYFENDLLETYRIGDSIKKKIMGLWKLDSTETKPASFPTALYRNFCFDLKEESKLLFAEDGEGIIYNGSTLQPCKQYYYKVFRGYLTFEEFETNYSYEIISLDDKSLVLAEEFGDQNIFYFTFVSE